MNTKEDGLFALIKIIMPVLFSLPAFGSPWSNFFIVWLTIQLIFFAVSGFWKCVYDLFLESRPLIQRLIFTDLHPSPLKIGPSILYSMVLILGTLLISFTLIFACYHARLCLWFYIDTNVNPFNVLSEVHRIMTE